MITATFKRVNNSIVEYEIKGHANYAEKGKDIVCASVSSLYLSITNYLIANDYAYLDDEQVVQLIEGSQIAVEILHQGLVDISKEYPDHMVVEVECIDET